MGKIRYVPADTAPAKGVTGKGATKVKSGDAPDAPAPKPETVPAKDTPSGKP